jgi:GH24 family phage-related lysozyme (muramidase)
MPWRVAKSLDVLLSQVDRIAPERSKAADGSIGDAAHAARNSDHNPWVKDGAVGVVTARDFTHDPAGGFDAYAFAEALRAGRDDRIKYVISNRRIFSGAGQDHPAWQWRLYSGKNPHNHHTHVSVKPVKALYDSEAPWAIALPAAPEAAIIATPAPLQARPTLKKGARGETVRELQTLLNNQGASLALDGVFGQATLNAVLRFQRAKGLVADGIVGIYTWAALQPGAPAVETPLIEPGRFKASDYAIAWCKTFEAFRPRPYNDAGTLAIGYGHNAASGLPPIPKEGDEWTEEYADAILRTVDAADKERILNVRVTVPLAQHQIDALVLDQFQQGPIHGELLARVNSGDFPGAAKLIRERPTKLAGLARRYGVLADIFEGLRPDPKSW